MLPFLKLSHPVTCSAQFKNLHHNIRGPALQHPDLHQTIKEPVTRHPGLHYFTVASPATERKGQKKIYTIGTISLFLRLPSL